MKKMKTSITFCALFTLPLFADIRIDIPPGSDWFSRANKVSPPPPERPFDDAELRRLLEVVAISESDVEYLRSAEKYREYVGRCEQAGMDRRRVLDICQELLDGDEDFTARWGIGKEPLGVYANLLWFMGESGDRAALPYLEKKSFDPDTHYYLRTRAAETYAKIADVDEGIALMRKLLATGENLGAWKRTPKDFIDKISAEAEKMGGEASDNVISFLLEVVQNGDNSWDAYFSDAFLVAYLPGYADSRQRATILRFADTKNEWQRRRFAVPLIAHFDAIPPSERTDLRIRYPGLPPLPDDPDAAEASVPRAWLITAVGVATLAAAALALLRRARKPLAP